MKLRCFGTGQKRVVFWRKRESVTVSVTASLRLFATQRISVTVLFTLFVNGIQVFCEWYSGFL